MLLSEVFDQRSIHLDLAGHKEAVFVELAETIADRNSGLNREHILDIIHSRESRMISAITGGVAIPHGCYPGFDTITGALGISPGGIEYGAPEQGPVYVVCMMIMGEACREKHLRTLNLVLSMIKSGDISRLRAVKNT